MRSVDHLPRHLHLQAFWLVELDADHAPLPTRLHQHLVFGPQCVDRIEQLLTLCCATFDQILLIQNMQHRQSNRHAEIVSTKARGMNPATVHAVEHLLINRSPRNHRTDRDVSTAERLAGGDDVGLKIPMLEGEKFASTSVTRLYLVAEEQRAILAAKGLHG